MSNDQDEQKQRQSLKKFPSCSRQLVACAITERASGMDWWKSHFEGFCMKVGILVIRAINLQKFFCG